MTDSNFSGTAHCRVWVTFYALKSLIIKFNKKICMKYQNEIVEQLKELATNVNCFSGID